MHTLKPSLLESIVSGSFEKTKQLLRSAKRSVWRYGALGLMSILPTIGYGGVFSDDFETTAPLISLTSPDPESAWTVRSDPGDPIIKSNGKLELKAPSDGNSDQIVTPLKAQGSSDTILEAEFPAQTPLEKTRYGIQLL